MNIWSAYFYKLLDDEVTIILSLLKIRCPLLTSCCLSKLTALPILRPRPARFQKSDIKIRYPWPLPCCTVVQYFCIAKSWCNCNQTILCLCQGSTGVEVVRFYRGSSQAGVPTLSRPNGKDWKDYQVDYITYPFTRFMHASLHGESVIYY